jgi:Family of unknown function (DUF5519)
MTLEDRLARLPGVEPRPSQWTGSPAFWVDGREIVHFHGGEVEIRLTRRLINKLDDPRVWRRTRTSDWVGVRVEEVALALELARRAVEANRRELSARGRRSGRG